MKEENIAIKAKIFAHRLAIGCYVYPAVSVKWSPTCRCLRGFARIFHLHRGKELTRITAGNPGYSVTRIDFFPGSPAKCLTIQSAKLRKDIRDILTER